MCMYTLIFIVIFEQVFCPQLLESHVNLVLSLMLIRSISKNEHKVAHKCIQQAETQKNSFSFLILERERRMKHFTSFPKGKRNDGVQSKVRDNSTRCTRLKHMTTNIIQNVTHKGVGQAQSKIVGTLVIYLLIYIVILL